MPVMLVGGMGGSCKNRNPPSQRFPHTAQRGRAGRVCVQGLVGYVCSQAAAPPSSFAAPLCSCLCAGTRWVCVLPRGRAAHRDVQVLCEQAFGPRRHPRGSFGGAICLAPRCVRPWGPRSGARFARQILKINRQVHLHCRSDSLRGHVVGHPS